MLIVYDWWIDFNAMSIQLGLFYVLRLGNPIHCIFIVRIAFPKIFLLEKAELVNYLFQ